MKSRILFEMNGQSHKRLPIFITLQSTQNQETIKHLCGIYKQGKNAGCFLLKPIIEMLQSFSRKAHRMNMPRNINIGSDKK